MDALELEKRFTYHAPKNTQPKRYESIRQFALDFANLIDKYCPDLEEAVMWANASIARNE